MILPEIRLQIAPNPIFRQKAPSVKEIDLEIKYVVSSVHDIIYRNGAVGIGADIGWILEKGCSCRSSGIVAKRSNYND